MIDKLQQRLDGDSDAADDEKDEHGEPGWRWHAQDGTLQRLVALLLVHEVWVMLQHLNVLLNPLCQRLDRGYGISLLKKRQYWVIAGVLGAYWLREILSMLAALPYTAPLTSNMIAVSCVYHLGKIILVSIDAQRGWSPTLGIMRLLIDHWHLRSLADLMISAKRFALQARQLSHCAFDSLTHVLIVRDLVSGRMTRSVASAELERLVVITSLVWALHALANVVTGLSTATLMVRLAKAILEVFASHPKATSTASQHNGHSGGSALALDGGRGELTCGPQCRHGHGKCVVCHLLTRDMPPQQGCHKGGWRSAQDRRFD
ncbi:hypothetical protein JKP88DRAFT_203862 [Tribonema minus]|uniref:Uncharacterized protein n=1 Tax=Tribonema minus TaxID=303371 RepID=A0A836C6P6_9STRA|nr:hypothetical protein JKP88DRAFT_203862 [Tribonema minus]